MTRASLSRFAAALLLSIVTFVIAGCRHSVDDERIPYSEVRLTFRSVGDWNRYGIGGAAESKRFIKSIREPADFPYTEMDRTGFGGLLLSNDAMGNLVVYDLSCPYEARPNIRIYVPEGEPFAQCPECGSTFDIYTNYGNPRSGPAAEKGYGLQRYSSVRGGALEYLVITR